jgi:hypothetical protein
VRRTRLGGIVFLALLGLVVAAAVTYAASTLVSQPIGLTSEPATLGEGLAPARGAPAVTTTGPTLTRTVTVTTTRPVTAVPPPTRGEDDDDRDRDRDEDDD